jgi:two-component system, chemotaxis family, chemotaxis protein CheY
MTGSMKTDLKAADLARLCVLIVDDNEHMRVLLRRLLGKLGIDRTHEYAEARAALADLSLHKPNLIFTDLSMENMDGIELTRALRRLPSESECTVPVVMVTGHTERHHIEAARDAGVNEILAKPITVAGLTQRIEEIVLKPRPFVRSANYIGPCRRRRANPNFIGPWRRKDDQDVVVIDTQPPNGDGAQPVRPAKRLAH